MEDNNIFILLIWGCVGRKDNKLESSLNNLLILFLNYLIIIG